jgi:hypothetical protein
MAGRRKSIPMETQPGRHSTEAATPMSDAPSKRHQSPGKPTSGMPRSQADTARKSSLKKQRSMLHK